MRRVNGLPMAAGFCGLLNNISKATYIKPHGTMTFMISKSQFYIPFIDV